MSHFGHKTLVELVAHLREHASRVASGGPDEGDYDPETLALELEAADVIERLSGAPLAEGWATLTRDGIVDAGPTPYIPSSMPSSLGVYATQVAAGAYREPGGRVVRVKIVEVRP